MAKTRVILNCVASRYASTDERIIEFSHPNGGGLIAFLPTVDGKLRVDVYRTDPTVVVLTPSADEKVKEMAHGGSERMA